MVTYVGPRLNTYVTTVIPQFYRGSSPSCEVGRPFRVRWERKRRSLCRGSCQGLPSSSLMGPVSGTDPVDALYPAQVVTFHWGKLHQASVSVWVWACLFIGTFLKPAGPEQEAVHPLLWNNNLMAVPTFVRPEAGTIHIPLLLNSMFTSLLSTAAASSPTNVFTRERNRGGLTQNHSWVSAHVRHWGRWPTSRQTCSNGGLSPLPYGLQKGNGITCFPIWLNALLIEMTFTRWTGSAFYWRSETLAQTSKEMLSTPELEVSWIYTSHHYHTSALKYVNRGIFSYVTDVPY